jgi:hypothetical protein
MSEKYPGGFVTYNPPTPSQTSATGIWTLSQQEQYQQAGLWPNSPSQVSRSLRFNKDDSTSLSRTPTYAGNRTTWTWSAWVKRTNLSDFQYNMFGAATDGSNYDEFRFITSDKFRFFIVVGGTIVLDLITTQVFRDPSAWYHLVVSYDSTQATSSNRAKFYVNGVQVTAFDTAVYPAQNTASNINSNVISRIGLSTSGFLLNCYMANVQFVDGQALTPTSFGEYNSNTGVWQPLQKNLTYGTNGFQLTFNDNTNTTATTLGADSSGNGNNWTPSNFSVTTGANNDSMVDSPTSYGTDTGVGGEVRGNYATLNPLDNGGATVTNGNLDWDSASNQGTRASFYASTGKWYWEITSTEANLIGEHGVAPASKSLTGGNAFPGSTTGGWGFSNSSGNKSFNGTFTNIASAGTNGDVMMYALDMDAGKIWFGRNGTWFSSGNPASGTNEAFSGLTGTLSPMTGVGGAAAGSVSYNFGQRPFAYTAPSGFKALCTQNLPTPTIGATSATLATSYFAPVLYTGTGATQSITGVGFQPDFVWAKGRSGATDHALYDAVRGVQKQLESNNTDVETTETTGITAFGSDGFTTGALAQLNTSSATYVAWNWKANGAGSSNTAGTITSTVSANTTSGFSVVTYTGTGTNATVGHGLGVAPNWIIVRRRNVSEAWGVRSNQLTGNNYSLLLNSTAAESSSYSPPIWGTASPTSTVFSIGTSTASNQNTGTYVAYCFAPIAGYSAMGSYTGNGSADGPFIYTGFRPAFILYKSSSTSANWHIVDATRNPYNAVNSQLYPNSTQGEFSGTDYNTDFLSNGFKLRGTDTDMNGSGTTYIFMAFASNPFKYSLAR